MLIVKIVTCVKKLIRTNLTICDWRNARKKVAEMTKCTKKQNRVDKNVGQIYNLIVAMRIFVTK